MLEINILQQLDAFKKLGTLSAAAEYLHLAQPSLSRSMQKLEDELGVTLFNRQKNKLTLNETGTLAAEYAARILASEAEMKQRIHMFDKSLRTLTIGSCAPGPLMKILPRLTGTFSDMTVSSDIAEENVLMEGLHTSACQLAILSHPVADDDMICQKYITEHLFLSVNNFHPAATYHSISFKQMDGQNFIMYAKVGVWEDVVRKNMPRARFLKQEDLDAVGELAGSSNLPMFSTDITLNEFPSRSEHRINIPFTDKDAAMTFYLICTKENASRFRQFLAEI